MALCQVVGDYSPTTTTTSLPCLETPDPGVLLCTTPTNTTGARHPAQHHDPQGEGGSGEQPNDCTHTHPRQQRHSGARTDLHSSNLATTIDPIRRSVNVTEAKSIIYSSCIVRYQLNCKGEGAVEEPLLAHPGHEPAGRVAVDPKQVRVEPPHWEQHSDMGTVD